MDFDEVDEGSRIIYRPKYSSRINEDTLIERSPSGDFVKFRGLGWISRDDLNHYDILEVLSFEDDDMYPNCLTPWKCNGPHLSPCRGAPGGSHQLERYMDALELSKYTKGGVRV